MLTANKHLLDKTAATTFLDADCVDWYHHIQRFVLHTRKKYHLRHILPDVCQDAE